MYWKGHTKPASTCNKLASNIDLFPTIAELSGAPLPQKKIDGISIVPLIEGVEGANPREYFVYYLNKNDLQAVTDGKFKLVFPHKYQSYEDYEPGNDGQPGLMSAKEVKTPELYDLRRDPGERYNVIGQYPEVVRRLMNVAEEARADLGDDLTRRKGSGRREPGHITTP